MPTYLPNFPIDPSNLEAATIIGYTYFQETGTGRVHVFAENPEPAITRNTPIEIVR